SGAGVPRPPRIPPTSRLAALRGDLPHKGGGQDAPLTGTIPADWVVHRVGRSRGRPGTRKWPSVQYDPVQLCQPEFARFPRPPASLCLERVPRRSAAIPRKRDAERPKTRSDAERRNGEEDDPDARGVSCRG